MYSFQNDTVLDPFSGSGTTAVACVKAGRNSVSVDVSPTYVRQAIDRVKRADLELIAA
jgi:site-specific DNA-methyltransferase (adenine-specific)